MSDTVTEPATTEATATVAEPTEATGPYASFFDSEGLVALNAADDLPSDWADHDLGGLVAEYAGKPLDRMLRDHKELRSRIGKLGDSVVLPGENSSAEDIANYRQKIGAPDEADGYGLDKAPEGFEGEWNAEFGQTVAQVLHEAHAPKALADKLMEAYNAEQQRAAQAAQASENEAGEADEAELRKLWGDDYEINYDGASRIARGFGLDLENFSASDVAVMLSKIDRASQEDGTVLNALNLSQTQMGAGNPKQKFEEIMRSDAYKNGDPEARKQAHFYMQQYHQMQSAKQGG